MNRFVHRVITLAALSVLAPQSASGQTAGPVPPRPGAAIQQPPKDEKQIKVKVDLVTTPVTVRDARGDLVLTLEKQDFRVFDNGVEQRIEDFDLGGEPLSLVVAIESSSRIEALLPAVRKTGIMLTQSVLGQAGEAAVLAFEDEVNLVQPFTQNHDVIEKAVAGVRLGRSGVKLYDAMDRGVSLLSERAVERRRVLLLISEAADTESEAKLGEVLRRAQLASITIYSVGLSTTAAALRKQPGGGPKPIAPEGTFGLPGRAGGVQTPTTEQQRMGNIDLLALGKWAVTTLARSAGENSLEVATVATGGRHMAAFKDSSIESALSEIGAELHAQYSLSYRPTGTEPLAGYHEIKVQLARKDLHARSRPGYYLAP